ncbi:unnamed protein product [Symbiodinium sp. CCMP2456]|nr:unnamed protein product [Symbiodinium sp. CCMP2456]
MGRSGCQSFFGEYSGVLDTGQASRSSLGPTRLQQPTWRMADSLENLRRRCYLQPDGRQSPRIRVELSVVAATGCEEFSVLAFRVVVGCYLPRLGNPETCHWSYCCCLKPSSSHATDP